MDAVLQRDERRDRLALELMRPADDRRLRNGGMIDQRALHFHGADAVTGDVEHVVDAPQDPPVPVVIQLGAVAGEVATREPAPVGVAIALVVAVDGAQHARPRRRDGQEPTALGERGPLYIHQLDIDAGEGNRR